MLHDSLIAKALSSAREKMNAGVSHEKVAESGLVKEAEEVANALEFVALSVADDGSAQGSARAEMIRDFFKKSAEAGEPVAAKSPIGIQANFGGDGSTQAKGDQGEATTAKRKILPLGLAKGDKPKQTAAPDGAMDRGVMAQEPPAVKKAGTVTLFDMIQNSRMGKEAATPGGPAVLDPETKAPGIPAKNENVNRESLLSSSAGIVNATKRAAKQPGRARLAELFASAKDTTGDADARAIWPNAAAKGAIKVAATEEPCPKCKKSPCACEKGEKKASFLRGLQKSAACKKPVAATVKKASASASLAELADVWDKAITGELGAEVQQGAEALVAQIKAE